MSAHRALAIAALRAVSGMDANGFMQKANLAMPVMVRETVPAVLLHRLVDVEMQWTIARGRGSCRSSTALRHMPSAAGLAGSVPAP